MSAPSAIAIAVRRHSISAGSFTARTGPTGGSERGEISAILIPTGTPGYSVLPAYRKLGYHEGQFPNAERIGRETVTLPLFPAMELADVDRVVQAVNEIITGARL